MLEGSPQHEASTNNDENGNGKGGGENSEWQPYKDPDSGSIFWYNTTTHVSQWECPFDDVDFQAGADSDDDEAVEITDADDLGL